MATADKVQSLVERDEGLADAIETVYRTADDGDGTVEWSDVNEDVSSGHWGRLIEQEVLVDGGEGFRFDDPTTVAEVLDLVEDGDVDLDFEHDPDDIEDSSWTTYDKMAAAGALALFAGYSLQEARQLIGTAIDVFVGPLNAVVPFHVTVLVIAVLTGLVSTLVQGNMMDQEKVQMYQDRMSEIQERRKEAKERGDDEALEKIQEEQMEAMGDQLGMFKENFRPTVWIMLFTIPMFLWIYWQIFDVEVASSFVMPLVGQLQPPAGRTSPWLDKIVGPMQAWIVWYFLCSMAFNNLIRKSLDIQGPTGS
jgi:uncharacterized membrane protein (DUF106 family)